MRVPRLIQLKSLLYWTSEGAKADPAKVSAVVDKVRVPRLIQLMSLL